LDQIVSCHSAYQISTTNITTTMTLHAGRKFSYMNLSSIIWLLFVSVPCFCLEEKLDNGIENENNVAVVHLGKCGGVSLKQTIKNNPDSAIFQRGVVYYHLEQPNTTKFDTWIALVRNPVERFQSAWLYEHTRNLPFRKDSLEVPRSYLYNELKERLYDCYPSFNMLITQGLTRSSKRRNDCPMLAKQLFEPAEGNLWGMYHFRWNFDYYYSDLLQHTVEKKIYIVQTENMLNDLNKIDELMGGTGAAYKDITLSSHFSTTALPVKKRTFNPTTLSILCKWLCPEIQVYKNLFRAAENYNDNYVSPTLETFCPDQVKNSNC